jgi:hypothetical protein
MCSQLLMATLRYCQVLTTTLGWLDAAVPF